MDIFECDMMPIRQWYQDLFMRLDFFNVTHYENKGFFNERIFAMVNVTKGFLWWRKTKRQQIKRYTNDDCWKLGAWHFVDNFQLLPKKQIDGLEREWLMRTGNKI